MGAWKVNRARALLALANLIVVAGFAAVLPLVLSTFTSVKEIPYVQAVLAMPTLIALAGLVVMFIGSAVASRQRYVLDVYRHRRADAQRRIYAYRIDERIEPSLDPRGKQQQA